MINQKLTQRCRGTFDHKFIRNLLWSFHGVLKLVQHLAKLEARKLTISSDTLFADALSS